MSNSDTVSTIYNGVPTLKDFTFNGWGNKYPSILDNKLNLLLFRKGIYKNLSKVDFILEGGSIESNGNGILLTTKKCLLNSNRNKGFNFDEIENVLKTELHAKKILWLENGVIFGDDTDAHIDTLARFVNEESIVYVKCFDTNNPNFKSLNRRLDCDVLDENDRLIGKFKQKLFSIGGKFNVLDQNENTLCKLKGKWTSWDFKFVDEQNEYGHVSKKWAGLGKEMFTTADNYMLNINETVPKDDPLRILILAAVVCIDMVLKE